VKIFTYGSKNFDYGEEKTISSQHRHWRSIKNFGQPPEFFVTVDRKRIWFVSTYWTKIQLMLWK
jgi:hypothetical protein